MTAATTATMTAAGESPFLAQTHSAASAVVALAYQFVVKPDSLGLFALLAFSLRQALAAQGARAVPRQGPQPRPQQGPRVGGGDVVICRCWGLGVWRFNAARCGTSSAGVVAGGSAPDGVRAAAALATNQRGQGDRRRPRALAAGWILLLGDL